jgi:hypothetical protein
MPQASKKASGGSGAQSTTNIERVNQIVVSALSAADAFRFFSAKVPALVPFEDAWISQELNGKDLCSLDPFSFTSELSKSFPAMPVGCRNRLFEAMKAKVALDFAKNTATEHFISVPTGQAWASAELGATAPAVLERFAGQIQPPTAPPFAPPPVVHSLTSHQTPSFGSPKASPFVFGPKVTPKTLSFEVSSAVVQQHSSAQMPALAGQQLQGPPSGVVQQPALQMLPLGSQGPGPPSGVAQQPLHVSQPPSGVAADAQMLALAGQQGAVSDPKSSDLVYHSTPKFPWTKAAEQRVKTVSNPNFPVGFTEINTHQIIADAIEERKRQGNPVAFQLAAPVVWPEFAFFNKDSFVSTRTLFHAAVLASQSSGLFRTFKSTVQQAAKLALFTEFELDEKSFNALGDEEFLNYCSIHFGPKSARSAVLSLQSVKMENHRDKQHCQSTFVQKFDNLRVTFELAVNDMVKCHSFWPTDPKHEDYGHVELKKIMEIWANIFPKPNTKAVSPISVQMDECRNFIDLNKHEDFGSQVMRLRRIFVNQDNRVIEGRCDYTTKPEVAVDKKDHQPRRQQLAQDRFASSTAASRPGGGDDRPNRQPRQPYGGPQEQAKGKKREAPKFAKSVPGHQRCCGCGSANNHFGLGYSKNSCHLFNHPKAKPRGYVWKSTDDEPSVRIDSDEYKRLMNANPQIKMNWDKARSQIKQSKQAKIAALAAAADSSDDNGQNAIDDVSASDNEAVNDDEYCSNCDASAASLSFPIASVSALQLPLSEFGHESQFFGLTRFANNDAFVAKTLMDPGAELNIISPTLANRCAIKRQQLDVHIYQGKRKQTTVNEVVYCSFELMNRDKSYTQYSDWFAVSDLGYSVLLGRRFNRVNGFTTFDERLSSFDSISDTQSQINVASLSDQPTVSSLKLRFARTPLDPVYSSHKRNPKRLQCLFTNGPIGLMPEWVLRVNSQFSSLKCLDKKTIDGDSLVKLEFVIEDESVTDKATFSEWFKIVSNDGPALLATTFAERLKLQAIPTVVDECKVSAIHTATNNGTANVATELHHVESDPSNSFKQTVKTLAEKFQSNHSDKTQIHARDHAPYRFRGLSEQQVQDLQHEQDTRFVSYHPIKKHNLIRNALPPVSPHLKKNHQNHLANFDYRGEKAAIVAAFQAASSQRTCRALERKYNAMVSSLKAHDSQPEWSPHCPVNRYLERQWINASAIVNSSESEADITEPPSAALSALSTEGLQPGCYAEICGAVNHVELNGQRVRLYSKQPDNGKWIIRVLGAHSAKWLCDEVFLKALSPAEQRRSTPAAVSAALEDMGIDVNGQPDIDLKNVVHRQFGEEYSAALTKRIEELKTRYPTVFTNDVSEPCLFEPMKITLIPNAVLPTKAHHYRNTPKMREEIRRQIQEQLEWGCIRKCVTPHVSDVLLVKRPHMPGKFRFVVSYLKLNDATVKEQLIMPDPKSQYERLAGNNIFGALDFSNYYRQVRLHEDSQLLTGFASDEGTFCYTRVPMGITGACQYCQKALQEKLAADPILGPLGFKNYFDDLPFGTKTEDEFISVLTAMLDFCERWKLKLNPDKCVLGVKSITHVGFVVSADGVTIDPERNKDIRELTAPKSIKKVQSVLGIVNYVRNFIPNFSDKAKFLTDKLAAVPIHPAKLKRPRSEVDESSASSSTSALNVKLACNSKGVEKAVPKFSWSADDDAKFQELKQCVLQAPMLAHLDYTKPIYIRCDASRFGAGAVLFQYDDRGYENVVCYASRKFLPAERNWSTFSQEASTVVWALERFSEYTQGYHVIVECDHRNISFVKKSAMPQLARWRLRLQDVDFSIRYLSGPQQVCADGLSRQHIDDVEVEFHDVIPECALKDETIEQRQLFAEISAIEAVEIAPMRTRSTRTVAPSSANRDHQVADNLDADFQTSSDSDSSSIDDNDDELGQQAALFNVDQPDVEMQQHQPQMRVPILDATSTIRQVHNDLLGHAGTFVTLQRVLRNNKQWGTRKQMIIDIDTFLRGCPSCQKMRKRKSSTFIDRHTISGSPFAELSIDMLKLPDPDSLGMQYVVVIVDSFSHWVSLTAVRNKSAYDAARALVNFIGNFGAPLRVRSDGGKEFLGGVLTGMTRLMGASNHVVLPYTPTANGIVERANRAVLERLREMIFSKRLLRHTNHQWSDLLPLAQRSINGSIHSATGTSPARIVFGDNLDLDRCLLSAMPDSKTLNVQDYVDSITFNQRVILEEADEHQSKLCQKVIAKSTAKQRRKNRDGSFSLPAVKSLAIGDWVLVHPQPNYPLHKLAPRWLGPFQIDACNDQSEVVTVFDTLKLKRRKFLRRQLELFDVSQLADVEGLSKVAESDNFEFPVESIQGHALINEGGIGSNPDQLPLAFKRGSRKKSDFQFLIKWAGYEEPTWIAYKVASRLVQFPGYVALLPDLKM